MKASPIRCLVTAGPTREFFDPVRFVSNPSSGKMGYALAEAAAERGWETELVSGPVELRAPGGVNVVPVVTGAEMYEAVSQRFGDCDVLIMTAAILDYRPREVAKEKVKKDQLKMLIEMEPVVDVLAEMGRRKEHQLVVGFAAETCRVEEYGRAKLEKKQADLIVANRIGGEDSAFGRDDNEVIVLGRDGYRLALGPESKAALASRLVALFGERVEALAGRAEES